MASTQQWIKENQTPRSNQGPKGLQGPQLSHRGRYNSRLSSMHTLESDFKVWAGVWTPLGTFSSPIKWS